MKMHPSVGRQIRGCLNGSPGFPAVLSLYVGTITNVNRKGEAFTVYDGQRPVYWKSWVRVDHVKL